MSYLPYYDKLDEKYKQIYLEWDKEILIDHLVANIHNGEVLLERINKTIDYIENCSGTYKNAIGELNSMINSVQVLKIIKGESNE